MEPVWKLFINTRDKHNILHFQLFQIDTCFVLTKHAHRVFFTTELVCIFCINLKACSWHLLSYFEQVLRKLCGKGPPSLLINTRTEPYSFPFLPLE